MNGVDWPAQYEAMLRDHLPGLDSDRPITPELTLADCGLDSIGMVSLLVAIEDNLEITFPDELLTADTFATAGTLWKVVQQVAEPSD